MSTIISHEFFALGVTDVEYSSVETLEGNNACDRFPFREVISTSTCNASHSTVDISRECHEPSDQNNLWYTSLQSNLAFPKQASIQSNLSQQCLITNA